MEFNFVYARTAQLIIVVIVHKSRKKIFMKKLYHINNMAYSGINSGGGDGGEVWLNWIFKMIESIFLSPQTWVFIISILLDVIRIAKKKSFSCCCCCRVDANGIILFFNINAVLCAIVRSDGE